MKNGSLRKFKILDQVVVNTNDEVLTVIENSSIGMIPVDKPYSYANSSYGLFTLAGHLQSSIMYKLAASDGTIITVPENEITLVGSARKKLKADLLKMYVLVKNTAPIGLGINAVGHATFMAGQTFNSNVFNEWKEKSFRKVTCLVSPEEFDAAIQTIKEIGGNYVVFNENDWNDQDLSVAFEPRYSFPEIFKTFKLHSGAI